MPAYTAWGSDPEIFIQSFQHTWLIIAALGSISIVTSALRGAEAKKKLE